MSGITLIGAGGHAKGVAEAVIQSGHEIVAYCDPNAAAWLDVDQISEATVRGPVVIGIGGVTPHDLAGRCDLLYKFLDNGCEAPVIIHKTAYVSSLARLDPGVIVMAQAYVGPEASLGRGTLVNTGSAVEHDATIRPGVHIAPNAVVCGAAEVDYCSMIGTGAVILPGTHVPPRIIVPALTRYSKPREK